MSVEGLQRAVAAIGSGQIVVVAGQGDGEDEGRLLVAASMISTAQMTFLIRHGSGLIYAPMTVGRANKLDLPLMATTNPGADEPGFTVTVDHFSTDTGVSAPDRVATVRALADDTTQPSDLRRPGHILPFRVHPRGILDTPGWAQATIELLTLARAGGVGVATELIGADGATVSGPRSSRFADTYGLPFFPFGDLLQAAGDERRS